MDDTKAAGQTEATVTVRMTPQTAEVYAAILSWFRDTGGAAPTIREIMRRCNLHSTSAVSYHLRRLMDVGLIHLAPGMSRGIMVTGAKWTPPPPVRIDETEGQPTRSVNQLRQYWSDAQRRSRAARKAAESAEVAA